MLGIEHYRRLDNFEDFCRDCLKIVTKQGHLVPFVLNSTQRIILRKIRELVAAGIPPRLLILKARQVGVSTLIEALLFWRGISQPNRSALILAHVLKSSKALFRMSRNFHRNMKGDFEQKTRIQNVHEIEFDSGSRLQVEVQGDPRGYTAQDVHLSEFAFYLNASETLTAIMQTVPMIVDSLVAIESTANGVALTGEKFHKMFQRAMGIGLIGEVPDDEKGWTPIFVPWFQHEEYQLSLRSRPFRPTIDEEILMREHPEVTFEKLKWRRWCIATNCDGDEEKFQQEYPATWEEAFLASGRPAFDKDSMRYYNDKLSELILSGGLPPTKEIEAEPPGIGVPQIIAHEKGRLRIFFEPEKRHTYVVGADPSEGDPGSDHSPLAVLDDQTMDLAATWYGKAPPDVLAGHAIDLARYFNEGLIINEANNHGILFHETVMQLGYANLYFRQVSEDSVAGQVTEKPGYLSTRRNREHLFNTLRKYVRMRMGRLHCPHIIQQILTLVYVDDKVQADVGMQKDLLVAFGLCLMAHRGSMHNPLEPHPEPVVRSVAAAAALLKEREGVEVAAEFVRVETGMTMDEVLNLEDAILARERIQRKYGIGGMR